MTTRQPKPIFLLAKLRQVQIAWLVIAAVRQSCAAGDSPLPTTAPAPEPRSLKVDGVERTYLLHWPITYSARCKVPLVIVLHGGSGRGGANIARHTGFNAKSDEQGFVVAYPDSHTSSDPVRIA